MAHEATINGAFDLPGNKYKNDDRVVLIVDAEVTAEPHYVKTGEKGQKSKMTFKVQGVIEPANAAERNTLMERIADARDTAEGKPAKLTD